MKTTIRGVLSKGIQIFIFVSVSLLFSCKEDPVLWKVESAQMVIADYVTSDPAYSEFAKILDASGLNSLLRVRGPFTLFLPNDSAMQIYYEEQGVSSYEELPPEAVEDLARNHMVTSAFYSGDFGLGALRDLNGLNDYLVSEFEGSDIIINKFSKIINRDIAAANGVVHEVDRVIEPVTVSAYQLVADDPSYSLFAAGLNMTGIKDTLSIIDFPYGQKTARTRFTLLAIADTTFNRYGIKTIDELIAHFTDAPDSITYIDNPFYRYMEYHCLGGTYYFNNLETQIYPILSYDNNISVRVDDDYKLNIDFETEKYTGFITSESNKPAKNGTVHTIDNLLPVFEPDPTQIVFETTDYFDLQQGDYFGKYYMRWFDGQNTFADIKWEGSYMLYYFKDHDTGKLMNDDCLSMSGWWWVEITTPKIMKGSYELTSNLWGGQISYSVFVDGVNTALIDRSDPAESTPWGRFNWPTTERHTIKVVAKSPGLLFWDTLIFTPLN
jgi:uncharacterized surface protein with fasciclin (FAS1) repeats